MRFLILVLVLWPAGLLACPALDGRDIARHLNAVNAVRAQAGLAPLAHDPALSAQAQAHACDMAARGYFAHARADGWDMDARLRAAGLRGVCRGAENIAKGQADIAAAMTSWMGSAGHRRNLLDPALTRVGFGHGPGRHWVQLFSGCS